MTINDSNDTVSSSNTVSNSKAKSSWNSSNLDIYIYIMIHKLSDGPASLRFGFARPLLLLLLLLLFLLLLVCSIITYVIIGIIIDNDNDK